MKLGIIESITVRVCRLTPSGNSPPDHYRTTETVEVREHPLIGRRVTVDDSGHIVAMSFDPDDPFREPCIE